EPSQWRRRPPAPAGRARGGRPPARAHRRRCRGLAAEPAGGARRPHAARGDRGGRRRAAAAPVRARGGGAGRGRRVSFEAVVYRATAHEVPLWAFPNTSAGRWNPAGSWPAQYLSLHPMTPWAEVMRTLGLRDEGAAAALRVPIWAVRV